MLYAKRRGLRIDQVQVYVVTLDTNSFNGYT